MIASMRGLIGASAARIVAASRPISTTARAWRASGATSAAEVLPLAVAAEDHDQFATLGAEAVQRRDRGTDVGAFAVVEVLDATDAGDELQPVRLTRVFTQSVQHRRKR